MSSTPLSPPDPTRLLCCAAPGQASKGPHVPFFDGTRVNGAFDVASVTQDVAQSGCYVLGPKVEAFEAAFAQYLGAQGCVGVNSGTDALELALRAIGVGPHSRVLMVANAAFYGSAAAHAVGATPVYVDVLPSSACMDPQRLEDALEKAGSFDAIIVTHLYGQMAAIADIAGLAHRYNVPLIEDCAQAHGAIAHGQKAGTFGALGTFSFYPTKNLGALGDGGAVVSRYPHLVHKVRALRQYGWSDKYTIAHRGGRNSRLDALQAAILSHKLVQLDDANAYRRRVAEMYSQAFVDLPLPLFAHVAASCVAHLCVVRAEARNRLALHLAALGVPTLVHFPVPDHLQPAYPCAQRRGDLPVTERLAHEVLSLPCYPNMPVEHVERVIAGVRSFFSAQKAAVS